MQAFGISEDQMEKPQLCWESAKVPKIREIRQPD